MIGWSCAILIFILIAGLHKIIIPRICLLLTYVPTSKLQRMTILGICGILTFIAISVFHRMLTGNPILINYAMLLGMGLPLLFNIKRKDIRNICLTIIILAIFMRQGWIGISCIGITYMTIFMHNKKFLMLFLPLCLILCLFVLPKVYPKMRTIAEDSKFKIASYKFAFNKWQNIWWGDGFRSWSKLPENQPEAESPTKPKGYWRHVMESDAWQSCFEFGMLVTDVIVVILVLPIFFIDKSSLLNRTILGSHLCLLFQFFVDFPFHRAITGTLGIWLIIMIYKQAFLKSEESYAARHL